MWKQNTGSLLVTGVPVARGRPAHIEHDDDFAQTVFDKGEVIRIHTPQGPFKRVHELMHAKHTDIKRSKRVYSGVRDEVKEITEDCKLHMRHWPWRSGATPSFVTDDYAKVIEAEVNEANERLAEEPALRGTWPDFAMRVRRVAVEYGMDRTNFSGKVKDAGFASEAQQRFAKKILNLVNSGKESQAAKLMQGVFMKPEPEDDRERFSSGEDDGSRSGIKRKAARGFATQPPMEIIELPHTVAIADAKIGYRRATSGSRLHRPSLRKPILPQRLFVRRTPREIQGTILVDASGSMGDWSQVKKWCEKAPFGTIAYYAGNGSSGKLFVYARNGKRAEKIVNPHMGGNTVDGPAMDWLMTQAKPRRMITDRGFCDVADSQEQVLRLELLERAGEIEVLDYAHDIEHASSGDEDDE